MIKRVQRIGHIKSAADLFLGHAREITVNTTDNAIRLHDGATIGGHETARMDVANVAAATGANDGKMTSSQASDLSTTKTAVDAHVDAATGHPVATVSADGFESAADKTKLDGIETAATADQSAAEILAALLTVDGPSSLLDADLLDGLEGSAYALDSNTVSAGTGLAGGGTIGSNPTISLDISTLGAAGALDGSESVAVDKAGEKRTTTQDIADLFVASASFPSGTAMLFKQTAAPTGWTKSSADDNKALRVVSGAVGTGGATAFTSVFGSGKAVGGTAISASQMPSHVHTTQRFTTGSANGISSDTPGAPNATPVSTNTTDTLSAGSGNTHNHTLSLDLQYVDIIVATKDA